jgi:hypothetical protein
MNEMKNSLQGIRGLILFVLLAPAAAACTAPTSPAGGVTLTTPTAAQPANGAQIANAKQPVTLTVTNAFVADGTAAVSYAFEVATDSAFATKVLTKTVTQTAGQTSLALTVLAAGDYYWHVQTSASGTAGTFSSASKFTIAPPIVIGTATAVSPLSGFSGTAWPPFIVTNATKTGPFGSIAYQFDIATSATFASIIVSATVSETGTQTGFTPAGQSVPTSPTTMFWRATPIDQTNGIAGTASAAQSFTLSAPIAGPANLWPGAQPPGTNGHAIRGDNWTPRNLVSFSGVPFVGPSLDMFQLFDLIDRGMAPQEGIDWMQSHGYPTDAAYFADIAVIGFQWQYMALISGRWDVVFRVGA